MAARSGTGMVVMVSVLGVLTLGLFVTTVVFLSMKQGADRRYNDLQNDVKEFVRDDERRREDVGAIKTAAGRAKKSVVGYLVDQQQETMLVAAGSKRATLEGLRGDLERVAGANPSNMMQLLRDRDSQISMLSRRVDEAEKARDRALVDRENEVKRVGTMETAQRSTLTALNTEVDKYKDEVERYREELNRSKAEMDARVQRIEEAFRSREADMAGQIREQQQQVVLAQETIKRLQDQLRGQAYTAGAEYALVDGEVIGADAAAGQYFLNIGRRNRAVLGMTFEVYSDASAIRPDERTGEYPQGKAALEVIRVDENSSTARLIREKRGNPVVKGDVIANAVYDPNKTYRFLVFGNFDADRDGRATPQGAQDIEAMIVEWGGVIVNELSGDVDFLVLGERPLLGPQPRSDAPVALIQQYVHLRRTVQEYDRLFEQATATSIPVLNENRLRTLIGGR